MFLRLLRTIGINIDLIVLEKEGLTPVDAVEMPDEYEFRFLSVGDIEALLRLEPDAEREKLAAMFQEGTLCFGAWDGARLIAKMWCDTKEIYHPLGPRLLAADEVYLLLAYVDPDYRGKNLAPAMRYAGYAALREIGITRFLSYSMFVNSQARRFKEKLGARSDRLIVYVRWFGKWSTCRTYPMQNQST